MEHSQPFSRFVLPLTVALALASVASAVPAADEAGRLDALLARYNEIGLFNGVALVARDGAPVLAKGYGMASFELRVPNTPATKPWIGSVSKVFTATAVMRLVDQGKLSLDARVADVLPWYRKDTGARMTVRQLLCHTSGLPDYMHLPGVGREAFAREAGDATINPRAFAEKWCSADLAWAPGTKWGYSNSGYVLLGLIVEQATRQPFERALRALVLDPLGLAATDDLAMRPRAVVEGLASGSEKSAGELVTRRHWNVSTAYGAGAMVSTVGDLLRFDTGLGREGFLSPAARAAMFTPGPGHWGCGFEVQTMPIGTGKAERTVIGHEGYIFWTLTRIYRIPEDRIFVALVNNTGDAPLQQVFAGIADILYGREPAWPKALAADAVRRVASEQGGAAAVARYRELLATKGSEYEFTERGLNALGYALLQEGKPADAVAVFELMVEQYPKSGNAWDSLGEGLAAAGRRDEAIAAYKRAFELDPKNTNAAAVLEKLAAKP